MKVGMNGDEWNQLLELKAKMNKEQLHHFRKMIGSFCCQNCGYVNKGLVKDEEWLMGD